MVCLCWFYTYHNKRFPHFLRSAFRVVVIVVDCSAISAKAYCSIQMKSRKRSRWKRWRRCEKPKSHENESFWTLAYRFARISFLFGFGLQVVFRFYIIISFYCGHLFLHSTFFWFFGLSVSALRFENMNLYDQKYKKKKEEARNRQVLTKCMTINILSVCSICINMYYLAKSSFIYFCFVVFMVLFEFFHMLLTFATAIMSLRTFTLLFLFLCSEASLICAIVRYCLMYFFILLFLAFIHFHSANCYTTYD